MSNNSLADKIKQRRQQAGITPTAPQQSTDKTETQSLPLNDRINKIIETTKLANYDRLAIAEELDSILSENKIPRDELSKKIGKTQGWISKKLALLTASPEIRDKMKRGELATSSYYASTAERIKKITISRKQAVDHARLLRDIGIKYGLNIELSQKPSNKEIVAAFSRVKDIRNVVLK